MTKQQVEFLKQVTHIVHGAVTAAQSDLAILESVKQELAQTLKKRARYRKGTAKRKDVDADIKILQKRLREWSSCYPTIRISPKEAPESAFVKAVCNRIPSRLDLEGPILRQKYAQTSFWKRVFHKLMRTGAGEV